MLVTASTSSKSDKKIFLSRLFLPLISTLTILYVGLRFSLQKFCIVKLQLGLVVVIAREGRVGVLAIVYSGYK